MVYDLFYIHCASSQALNHTQLKAVKVTSHVQWGHQQHKVHSVRTLHRHWLARFWKSAFRNTNVRGRKRGNNIVGFQCLRWVANYMQAGFVSGKEIWKKKQWVKVNSVCKNSTHLYNTCSILNTLKFYLAVKSIAYILNYFF